MSSVIYTIFQENVLFMLREAIEKAFRHLPEGGSDPDDVTKKVSFALQLYPAANIFHLAKDLPLPPCTLEGFSVEGGFVGHSVYEMLTPPCSTLFQKVLQGNVPDALSYLYMVTVRDQYKKFLFLSFQDSPTSQVAIDFEDTFPLYLTGITDLFYIRKEEGHGARSLVNYHQWSLFFSDKKNWEDSWRDPTLLERLFLREPETKEEAYQA